MVRECDCGCHVLGGIHDRCDCEEKRVIKTAFADVDEVGKRYVNDVLDSGWISRHKYMPEFEARVAGLHGCKYGMMCNSGTDALRIGLGAMKEAGEWPDGSEVI